MNRQEIDALLDRAVESIDAAEILAERGHHGFAVSRAYYAMFYCAQAVLLSRGKVFSSHAAVIAAFGREFVKSGELDASLHRHLREAFDARQLGDYDPTHKSSKRLADRTIARAKEFLAAMREFLARDQPRE